MSDFFSDMKMEATIRLGARIRVESLLLAYINECELLVLCVIVSIDEVHSLEELVPEHERSDKDKRSKDSPTPE